MALPAIRPLSRRERQIMDVLHRRGEATAAEVLADLPDPPTYSAVRALLRVLENKAEVTHRERGRIYVYVPTAPREATRQAALQHVVATFFGGSLHEAAAALVGLGDRRLSKAERLRIAGRITRAKREGR